MIHTYRCIDFSVSFPFFLSASLLLPSLLCHWQGHVVPPSWLAGSTTVPHAIRSPGFSHLINTQYKDSGFLPIPCHIVCSPCVLVSQLFLDFVMFLCSRSPLFIINSRIRTPPLFPQHTHTHYHLAPTSLLPVFNKSFELHPISCIYF